MHPEKCSFNIQGRNSKIKKKAIIADKKLQQLQQQKPTKQTLRTANGKHYLSGSKHNKQGVGIIIRSDTESSFLHEK